MIPNSKLDPRGASRPLLAILGLLLPAAASLAAPPPLRLALDVAPGHRELTGSPGDATDEDVSRRLQAHLIPKLESMGYVVDTVRDGRKAMREDYRYQAAVKVDVDARPQRLVQSAERYEDTVVMQVQEGAWARGQLAFWIREGERIVEGRGRLSPVGSQVHEEGSAAMLDDSEAVSRLLADQVAQAFSQWSEPLPAPPPQPRVSPRARDFDLERPARQERRGDRDDRERWMRDRVEEPPPGEDEPMPARESERGRDWDRFRRE